MTTLRHRAPAEHHTAAGVPIVLAVFLVFVLAYFAAHVVAGVVAGTFPPDTTPTTQVQP